MSDHDARPRLVLASGSPRRLALLAQIGVEPDAVIPADIEEAPRRNESPRALAQRLSSEKAVIASEIARKRPELGAVLSLAADTVVCVGRRVLPKCEILDEAEDCLSLLSGRAHRVYTGLTLVTTIGGQRHRLVETRVRFKRLSRAEMSAYLASGEWRGKAGGYAIQGLAGAFVVRLIGSYTSVVGLPLAETANVLTGEGYPVHRAWTPGA
ncbi:MAG: septum formation protein Maf [Bradyrhizobium sp.]|nr:MAG: septum formation protein Maf [Bradyrhizobium sp.]